MQKFLFLPAIIAIFVSYELFRHYVFDLFIIAPLIVGMVAIYAAYKLLQGGKKQLLVTIAVLSILIAYSTAVYSGYKLFEQELVNQIVNHDAQLNLELSTVEIREVAKATEELFLSASTGMTGIPGYYYLRLIRYDELELRLRNPQLFERVYPNFMGITSELFFILFVGILPIMVVAGNAGSHDGLNKGTWVTFMKKKEPEGPAWYRKEKFRYKAASQEEKERLEDLFTHFDDFPSEYGHAQYTKEGDKWVRKDEKGTKPMSEEEQQRIKEFNDRLERLKKANKDSEITKG